MGQVPRDAGQILVTRKENVIQLDRLKQPIAYSF